MSACQRTRPAHYTYGKGRPAWHNWAAGPLKNTTEKARVTEAKSFEAAAASGAPKVPGPDPLTNAEKPPCREAIGAAGVAIHPSIPKSTYLDQHAKRSGHSGRSTGAAATASWPGAPSGSSSAT